MTTVENQDNSEVKIEHSIFIQYIYPKLKEAINLLQQSSITKITIPSLKENEKEENITKELLERGIVSINTLIKKNDFVPGEDYEDIYVLIFIFSKEYKKIKFQSDNGVIDLQKHINNAIKNNEWSVLISVFIFFEIMSNHYFELLSKDLKNSNKIREILFKK
tara:strand:+ start:148 stop:636 length:489 start_codon:yes stop_codon:yes gene_type:complete